MVNGLAHHSKQALPWIPLPEGLRTEGAAGAGAAGT